jgi:hypothetical protein
MLIQRSQSNPLDIIISLNSSDNSVVNRAIKSLRLIAQAKKYGVSDLNIQECLDHPQDEHCFDVQLDIVLPAIQRWRSFIFHSDSPQGILEIGEYLADQYVPMLETFQIRVDSKDDVGYSPGGWHIFLEGAPNLSHVYISGVEVTMCQPPFDSITSLYLDAPRHPMDGAEFLDLLRESETLVSLHLGGIVSISESMPTFPPSDSCHSHQRHHTILASIAFSMSSSVRL